MLHKVGQDIEDFWLEWQRFSAPAQFVALRVECIGAKDVNGSP